MDDGATTVENCVFRDGGTGLSISDDSSTIRGCHIYNNVEHGIQIDTSENEDNEPAGNPIIVIENCVIENNGEQDTHYGLSMEQGTITVRNTLIRGSAGPSVFITPSDQREIKAAFDHCDFYQSFSGTGISTTTTPSGSATVTITNSILVDADGIVNEAGDLVQFDVSYSDVFVTGTQFLGDAITSANILKVDPGYVDPANGDFHLKADSQLLTAGKDGTYMGSRGSLTQVESWMLLR